VPVDRGAPGGAYLSRATPTERRGVTCCSGWAGAPLIGGGEKSPAGGCPWTGPPGSGWPAWYVWPISGATLDAGAAPAVLAAASAGVIVRPEGMAVAVGAIASLRRGDAGSGVGGGILLDSKNLTGDAGSGAAAGPAAIDSGAASGVVAASGVETAGGAEAASGAETSDGGWTACGADPASPAESLTARFRPHDWQLVCPRKTSVAPQKRHVGFCDPCPSVTLNLTFGQAPNCRALAARQYDHARRRKDRPLGPN
jgi:hypothetical protein